MGHEGNQGTQAPNRCDDEIDLIDLALALWRRKWLVLSLTVLGGLLGLIFAFQQNPKHEVTAVIMLGETEASGSANLVESPKTAVDWLRTGIIPAVASQETQGSGFALEDLDIQVKTGQSAAITIRAHPPSDAVPIATQVIEKASKQLAETADKPIRDARIRLQSEIKRLKIELARIKDPALLKQQRTDMKQEIQHNENLLASANEKEARLKEQVKRLQKLIALQQDRAEEINSYLKELRGERPSAAKVASANDAMTAMLLNNQVQQYANHLSDITQTITVELPQKISETRAELAEVQRNKQQLQTDIDQAELMLETFEKDHLRDVAELETKIENKQATLDTMETTGLLNPPQHSTSQPKGPPLLIALGTILGAFLGLFAALMAGFISSAKERLRQDANESDSPAQEDLSAIKEAA